MRKNRPVALVTGGAIRVGRAIVQTLGEVGFDVVFTYFSSETEAKNLARRLKCRAIRTDLTDAQNSVHAIADAIDRLDVLVNSASIYCPGDEKFRQMMAIHVETPLALCRRFERQLRRNRGHVINMVDLMVERPWPKYAAYCATKAALWNLTLSLARDLAPEVTVNGIAPGVVEWPDDFPIAQRKKYLKRVPLARAGTPNDVAQLVRFLVTGASYVTGQIIRLDGGRSMT